MVCSWYCWNVTLISVLVCSGIWLAGVIYVSFGVLLMCALNGGLILEVLFHIIVQTRDNWRSRKGRRPAALSKVTSDHQDALFCFFSTLLPPLQDGCPLPVRVLLSLWRSRCIEVESLVESLFPMAQSIPKPSSPNSSKLTYSICWGVSYAGELLPNNTIFSTLGSCAVFPSFNVGKDSIYRGSLLIAANSNL